MDHLKISEELERNGRVFIELLKNRPKEERQWRPAENKWCLLEIVCHLVDEEIYDFRARVKHTLETPDSPMFPIDPEGWVKERKYMEQDYAEKLEALYVERKKSVEWLRSLKSPDWQQSYKHPKLGAMTAELFLHNWLAHDYLHVRQIVRTQFKYLTAHSNLELDYAGVW